MTNDAAGTLSRREWALYFNFVRLIDAASFPATVQLTRINGDFYQLRPTDEFPPLAPGESVSIPFVAAHWAISESDAPAGFYYIIADEQGRHLPPVIPLLSIELFETENHTSRGPRDVTPTPTPASRYASHPTPPTAPAGAATSIVPTPLRVTEGQGAWRLTPLAVVHHDEALEAEARYLVDALEPLLGSRLATSDTESPGGISLRLAGSGDSEAYRLTADAGGVTITASGAAGVFYGIQTLRSLLPLDAYQAPSDEISVPALVVEDAPRFTYRGMHLDVARNFQPVESVERLLEMMAFYKLNRFHFHLTDDEGWRLAIDPLPELTEVGSRRGHTLYERDYMYPAYGSGPHPDILPGSGHYSRDEFIGLLRFAHERHIEVIPEIDVPGHARAAVIAMEARHDRLMARGEEAAAREFLLSDPDDASVYRSVQRWDDNVINVCKESSYRFLETVFDEIIAMYAEAGVPLNMVHVGGDEVPAGVWQQSPVCDALIASGEVGGTYELWDYFLDRIFDLIDSRGLTSAGWEEVAVSVERANGASERSPNPKFLDRNVVPYVWNAVWGWGAEDLGYRLANAGYPVVLSSASNLYFDLAYEKDPQEPGYYWAGFLPARTVYEFAPFHIFNTSTVDVMGNPISPADFADRPRLTPAGQQNILGIQGQLWTETVKSPERMEYMAFPRLLALAERAWAAEPEWAGIEEPGQRTEKLDAAWANFASRLGHRELPRLDRLLGGVEYRLPPPGAVIEDGYLRANVAYPGLAIRYTTDGTEPTETSPLYTGPVQVHGSVRLRTFDTRGRGSRTSVVEVP